MGLGGPTRSRGQACPWIPVRRTSKSPSVIPRRSTGRGWPVLPFLGGISRAIRCHMAAGNSQDARVVSWSLRMDVLLGGHGHGGTPWYTIVHRLLDRLLVHPRKFRRTVAYWWD